jgi:predicted metal-dependent enzyme (double-stranded beta helix superfamily)
LLSIAEGFAVSAPAIPELNGVTERSWVLLAVTDLFEAWAISWPPGGRIEFHDHGRSSGAVVVAKGCLTETSVQATDVGMARIATHHVATGEHRRFGPRYVHDLLNEGDEPAISVHVYGPRLTTMSYYELDPDGGIRVVRTEDVPLVGPFDVTSDHDPS